MSNRSRLGIGAAKLIGNTAKLGGKDVRYAGANYGWQSPASFAKLKKEGKLPVPQRLDQALNAYLAPLRHQSVALVRNLKAEALLRANQTRASLSKFPETGGHQFQMNAGGMQSVMTNHERKDFDSRGRLRTVMNTDGTEQRSNTVAFQRQTYDSLDKQGNPMHMSGLDQTERHIPKDKQQLRQANIKYQLGSLLGEVKPGEYVEASPIPGENNRNPRARMYDRATNGALASQHFHDDLGNLEASEVRTRFNGNNQWKNILGQTKKFDPQDLRRPLEELAKGTVVRRLASHPVAQAALLANDVIGGITGEKPTDAVGRLSKAQMAKSLQERLKRGERFILPNQLPF